MKGRVPLHHCITKPVAMKQTSRSTRFVFAIYIAIHLLSFRQIIAQALPDSAFSDNFRNNTTQGWNAGDATISVPLPDGRTLWLFGDSHINQYWPPTQTINCLHNTANAIVVQESADSFSIKTPIWAPGGFFLPEDHQTHLFWPGHGFYMNGKVYIVLHKREKDFPWAFAGNYCATLDFPSLEVEGIYPLTGLEGAEFGKAVIWDVANNWLYFYGSAPENWSFGYYLARCRPHRFLTAKPNWQYRTEDSWSMSSQDKASIAPGVYGSNSFSVFKWNGQYVMVNQEPNLLSCGAGKNINLYFSSSVRGPFGNPLTVYETPDEFDGIPLSTYNAQGHPSFGPDLLISYNVSDLTNSGDCPQQCLAPPPPPHNHPRKHPDTYRPRFIRVPAALLNPPNAAKEAASTSETNESGDVSLVVYPNPVTGNQIFLRLAHAAGWETANISIVSVEGKEVFRHSAALYGPETEIGLDIQLPRGIYMVKEVSEGRSSVERILVP